MRDYLILVLSAHLGAERQRCLESAYALGERLRKGTRSAALYRRAKLKALAMGIIEHDQVLTGRRRLNIPV